MSDIHYLDADQRDFDTVEDMLDAMNDAIRHGYICLVKWTCPKCGQRAESGEPNVFHSAGYYHDSPGCGAAYNGTRFGFAAILASDPVAVRELIQHVYGTLPEFDGDLPGLREKGGQP